MIETTVKPTDKNPRAIITRKNGYMVVNLFFGQNDVETFDVKGTDLDAAVKHTEKEFGLKLEQEHRFEGATAHPGQREYVFST